MKNIILICENPFGNVEAPQRQSGGAEDFINLYKFQASANFSKLLS